MNTSRVCTTAYGPYCASCVPHTAQSTVISEERHKATVGGARELVSVTRGFPATTRPLPFNSKHLTRVYLQKIARAMELKTKGSVTATRQMIEGKLIESGRESMNVQVVIEEDESAPSSFF